MNLPGYYSSGQFARMAGVTVRTIRFYDRQNILKPSYVNHSGARFYTDSDLARLQQILLLKYLGFSLDDIREMTIGDTDYHFLRNSLNLQKKLVQDRIEQMQLVESAIEDTVRTIEEEHQIDWSHMLELIHLTGMEKSLKHQYQNATNISARIRLHRDYSANRQGWFPWIYEQCQIADGLRVLELGGGNGALWTENLSLLPEHVHICLSDISEGMLRDARRNIGQEDPRFSFHAFDCADIPFPDKSFDLVIAGHVLFYCRDLPRVFREVRRVLTPEGHFLCSTYGKEHMKEISSLVQQFDSRIVLSAEKLYEQFGLENGQTLLQPFFTSIRCLRYEDSITLYQAEPLIEYILSCHGNQNQILLEHYKDFRSFTEKKTAKGFHITKDAGIFLCEK
ncbi:MAG: methyltransferase domain-containing protein [Lachnospiraceae bacterium]|nr:methyltransferase domain-containing protein [Lachnospiraceae bacterium]